MDVSSFIHMAGSERRKRALVLTLFEVYVERALLGMVSGSDESAMLTVLCLELERNVL